MKINPLKGMKDYLPEEMRLRDFVQGKILEVYRASGFERIPAASAGVPAGGALRNYRCRKAFGFSAAARCRAYSAPPAIR